MGFLIGYSLKGKSGVVVNISHLLFTDNTLVFRRESEDQTAYLSTILLCFEALSGLRVNLEKSVILPVGNMENIEHSARKLGCRVGTLPST